MARKPRDRARLRPVSRSRIAEALRARIEQRVASAGSVIVPAVPALADETAGVCGALFAALGRPLAPPELEEVKASLASALREAYAGSQRSKVVIELQAEPARPLAYAVKPDVSSLSAAYERWIGKSDKPLFGAHPDARVLALARELDPSASAVLDLGAGTGRNALALARLGFRVDAVELTEKFAEILAADARAEGLPVRVVVEDVFQAGAELGRDYALFIASELVPDFRGVPDLRRLFELAAGVLGAGGLLVVNLHVAAHGYTPERAAREFAQQCYSAIFTASEVDKAMEGLPFALVADDSVHDYERAHLPEEAWPPTPWYANWVSGRDVYQLDRDECPMELRWLVYRKTPGAAASTGLAASQSRRPRRVDPAALRAAMLRRWKRRAAATVELTLPALPAMRDAYAGLCFDVFSALGREFSTEQSDEGKRLFEQTLNEAFAASSRSNVVVTCEAPRGVVGRYTVTTDAVPLPAVYEEWLERLPAPLFGGAPDARLARLMQEFGAKVRVLDVGAGLGRNALPLARDGHAVDAVELTPKFAEILTAAAEREALPVRVLAGDVFALERELAAGYGVVLASGVVSDFRGENELRRLFELAARSLSPGGFLLLSAHVAADGYAPDALAREWAEQCSATLFTREELDRARAGLPLELVSDDSGHDFERDNSPEDAFPPTEAYPEWARGTHLYALSPEESPVELRWLAYRRA